MAVDNIAHLISFTFSAPADDRRENLDEIHPVQCNEIFLENQMNVQQKIQDHFWWRWIFSFFAYIEDSGAGKEGVRNFIHVLGSGHYTYYIKARSNLYQYSQQGQGSLTKQFKLAFVNHTKCGTKSVRIILHFLHCYTTTSHSSNF